jgi:hypothetical protein
MTISLVSNFAGPSLSSSKSQSTVSSSTKVNALSDCFPLPSSGSIETINVNSISQHLSSDINGQSQKPSETTASKNDDFSNFTTFSGPRYGMK